MCRKGLRKCAGLSRGAVPYSPPQGPRNWVSGAGAERCAGQERSSRCPFLRATLGAASASWKKGLFSPQRPPVPKIGGTSQLDPRNPPWYPLQASPGSGPEPPPTSFPHSVRAPSWRGRPGRTARDSWEPATGRSGPWRAPRDFPPQGQPGAGGASGGRNPTRDGRSGLGSPGRGFLAPGLPSPHPRPRPELPPLTQRRRDTDCAGKAALLRRAAAEAAGGAGETARETPRGVGPEPLPWGGSPPVAKLRPRPRPRPGEGTGRPHCPGPPSLGSTPPWEEDRDPPFCKWTRGDQGKRRIRVQGPLS